MARTVLRWMTVAVTAGIVWGITPPVAVAADQVEAGEPFRQRSGVRVRTAGPAPHIRVVCQDRAGRKIACADSARVALQLAYYGGCRDCPPVALPPSRYSGYWGYWGW
jgi:hypothetical protein